MQPNIRARRHPRAQSMVEFALVVPMLFLFILGIIEMSYALFVYTEVRNAASEGARAAAVQPCPSDLDPIKLAAVAHLPAFVDANTAKDDTSIDYSAGSAASADYGSTVTVTVDFTFHLLDPLTQSVIPSVHVRTSAARDITTGCTSLVTPYTPTPTRTATPLATPTSTRTPGPSPTQTSAPTATNTPNVTSTPTNSPTATNTPNVTSTPTNSPTPTNTPKGTSTPTDLPTPTNTPKGNSTSTPTDLPTATNTPKGNPTDTPTRAPTATPTCAKNSC